MFSVEGKADKYRLSKMIITSYNSQAGARISKISPIFAVLIVSMKRRKLLRANGLRSFLWESHRRDILRMDTKSATCLGANLWALWELQLCPRHLGAGRPENRRFPCVCLL